MSKPTRPPDAVPTPTVPAPGVSAPRLMALRVALALSYPVLAHLASVNDSGAWAGLAMASMVVFVLLEPLLHRRLWALLVLGACLLGLWWIAQTRYALMPLLAPPVVFIALVGWLFGRTLVKGRVPLITRIVEALYAQASMPMTPDLYRYTRQLTFAWALVLGLLAVINLLLALCAVPDGVLAQLGHVPPVSVTSAQWSLFANVLNYGIVGSFFVVEYLLRKRRFPQRPYRNVLEFGQQMARLGPHFWNQFLR